jgi:hypothetical protein
MLALHENKNSKLTTSCKRRCTRNCGCEACCCDSVTTKHFHGIVEDRVAPPNCDMRLRPKEKKYVFLLTLTPPQASTPVSIVDVMSKGDGVMDPGVTVDRSDLLVE